MNNTAADTGLISRSRSFAGILSRNKTLVRSPTTTLQNYLGHNYNATNKSVENSSPRPQKTKQSVNALTTALKSCIDQANEESTQAKDDIDALSMSSGSHKNTSRKAKKMEQKLNELEELMEDYNLQLKLREGVRSMAYAFSVSEGKEKEVALTNVKAGYRECTHLLCAIEERIQRLMGVFRMTMKGIQGFSRLIPGDVYEIVMKHGEQKWKTKGKVCKDGSQIWDYPRANFQAILGEVLHIKAAEVKTLGKTVLLGNKFCDVHELLSGQPQLMTVNLNPSGSLKLNIVVQWDPLNDESYSPSRKRRLMSPNSDQASSTGSSKSSSPANSLAGTVTIKSARLLQFDHEASLKSCAEYLQSLLEDVRDQYPVTREFYFIVQKILEFLEESPSSLSNIESALECFDFLDKEESHDNEEPELPRESPGFKLTEQTEAVLLAHINHSTRLVSSITEFYPDNLERLQQQVEIFSHILNGKEPDVPNSQVQNLWSRIADSNLLVTSDMASVCLQPFIQHNDPAKMSKRVIAKMLNLEEFSPQEPLTYYHFIFSLKSYDYSFSSLVESVM